MMSTIEKFGEVKKVLAELGLYKVSGGAHEAQGDPGLDYIEGQRRGSVSEKEGEILSALATNAHALEIGTGCGVSSVFIAQTARSLVTIDPDPFVIEKVHPILKNFSSKITTLPKLRPAKDDFGIPDVFDFIFIDGNHDTPFVVQDVKDARERLAIGGIIVVHDLHMPSVWQAIVDECEIQIHEFKTEMRLGLLLGV